MSAVGGLLGLGVGVGAVVGLSRLPPLRRPRLSHRLAPYLERHRDGPHDGGEPVTPFPTLERVMRPVVDDLAAALDRRLGGRAALARRLERAGSDLGVDVFRVHQVVWAALGLAGSLAVLLLAVARGRQVPVVVALLAMAVGAIGGVVARDLALDRAVRGREQRLTAEFPAVAEFLAFAVAAGEGADGALDRVCRVARGELGAEIARSLDDARVGLSLVDALRALADRTGLPVVQRFVDGLVIALERGTPMADVLRAQAGDARAAGSRALLEQAGRREIAMLVPVVFLVLPAVVLVALFPGFYGVVLAVP